MAGWRLGSGGAELGGWSVVGRSRFWWLFVDAALVGGWRFDGSGLGPRHGLLGWRWVQIWLGGHASPVEVVVGSFVLAFWGKDWVRGGSV